jgi:hypothetical protein
MKKKLEEGIAEMKEGYIFAPAFETFFHAMG